MKQQVVVLGLGRFGSAVATELVRFGHEVLGMDSDLLVVQRLSENLSHVVQADVTDEDTLVQLGEKLCKSPEDFKAWSQNLRHDQVLTTFLCYGQVGAVRQAEIMRGLGKAGQIEMPDAEFEAKVLRVFRNRCDTIAT